LSYRGRNRYGRQAGFAITVFDREGRRVIRLNPITSRGTVTDACHGEVPADAVPSLVAALESFINPESRLWGPKRRPTWPGRLQATPDGGPGRENVMKFHQRTASVDHTNGT
jgi:hypothetical protein